MGCGHLNTEVHQKSAFVIASVNVHIIYLELAYPAQITQHFLSGLCSERDVLGDKVFHDGT